MVNEMQKKGLHRSLRRSDFFFICKKMIYFVIYEIFNLFQKPNKILYDT